MGFRVGQKVECVDDEPRGGQPCEVVKGDIYTITRSETAGPWGAWVEVYEVEAVGTPFGFFADRFRPLQETGMSILKAILASPHKQLETVE